MRLPRIGIWSSDLSRLPAARAREAVGALERAGYGALWFPESVGSKEVFANSALFLAWTSRMVVAPGIANIYARDATAMACGAKALCEAYPGRFLLGLGVSHAPAVKSRGHAYEKPVPAMRSYLDAMDAVEYAGAEPAEAPRILAALGPAMLRLAAERSVGAHPYFAPVEHTAYARERLGPDAVLAPEVAVVLTEDEAEARRVGRRYTSYYLALDNYRNNLLRLGWAEAELADCGSDRLVDALVGWGGDDAVVQRVRAHLDAGADHVCVQALAPEPPEAPVEALVALAPRLLAL